MPRKLVPRDEHDRIYTDKELHRIVADLQRDMWMGTDKENPSVTTRLALIEKTIAEIGKLKWYLVVAILAVIADFIKGFFKF